MSGLKTFYKALLRPALFSCDAEKAHEFSITGLKTGFVPRFKGNQFQSLNCQIAGLNLPNPLGMAAGYDKNADVPDALLSLGFGHVEIGTVTPKPQPGNPRPRLFRLVEDEGVINRFGFNSKGHAAVHSALRRHHRKAGIVGVNIGANKESEDFAADYVAGIHAFSDIADYFTINISSPNTPGLRALQGANPLSDLLGRVQDACADAFASTKPVPVFLKIAPDLAESEMDTIAQAVTASSLDALIVSNTTLSRANLRNRQYADETGGLSGKPLFERSTIVLAKMYQRLAGHVPLIGVGGIHDAESAFQKMEAGASLIQLYSAMVYSGPTLPAEILSGIARRLEHEGISSITDIVGRSANDWSQRSVEG